MSIGKHDRAARELFGAAYADIPKSVQAERAIRALDRVARSHGHRIAAVRDWERQNLPGYMHERGELPPGEQPLSEWQGLADACLTSVIVLGLAALVCAAIAYGLGII